MQIGPALMLFIAVFMLVPLVMAFLSLTLKGSVNRWANVVLGAIFPRCGYPTWFAVQRLSAHATLVTLAAVVALARTVLCVETSKPT